MVLSLSWASESLECPVKSSSPGGQWLRVAVMKRSRAGGGHLSCPTAALPGSGTGCNDAPTVVQWQSELPLLVGGALGGA